MVTKDSDQGIINNKKILSDFKYLDLKSCDELIRKHYSDYQEILISNRERRMKKYSNYEDLEKKYNK